MTGRAISHYRILDKLGEGGMGVVYKAQDTHLDRFVALKILPPEKVTDPERKRRFVQEAKSASALNHPNIITIHDIASEAGVDFIVMEYVSGKTLDDLIARKGLRLSDVLKYAVQMAEALSAAHSTGIIHRDLKPSNLIVTEKGSLKVLDFGLVKLTEPVPTDPSTLTQSMRAEQPRTEDGTIVGTVAYMSPEQAQGLAVDARSDIFSFGAVLYEMLTGHRAFHGETKLATLSAVLRHDPPAIGVAVEGVPPELERITARCLRKDPDRRFQHMEDLKVALQELKEESDSGKLSAAPRVAVSRLRWSVAAGLAAGIVLTASAVALVWWFRRSPTPPANPGLVRLTSDSGLSFMPALSPDGRLLAYASDRSGEGNMDIWVKQVAGGEPVRLTTHPAADLEPAFSPDGTQIAFRSDREGRGIYVMSALGGGDERRVADLGAQPRWSPDGRWISYGVNTPTSNLIYVVPSTGGSPRQLAQDLLTTRPPVWSPDGKHLISLGSKDRKQFDWWVVPFEGSGVFQTHAMDTIRRNQVNAMGLFPFALSSAGVPAAWLSDNRIVFSAALADSRNIWTVQLAPQTWKVTAAPQRLTFGTGTEISPSIGGADSATGQQLLAFANIASNKDVCSLAMDHQLGKASGDVERVTRDGANDHSSSPSADGMRAAFVSDRSGRANVWLKELSSGRETAFHPTAATAYAPIIARDGSKLAYQLGEDYRQPEVYVSVISREGQPGVPQRVCEGCARPADFSADGQKLLLTEPQGKPGKVTAIDLVSGEKTELVSGNPIPQARLSPDGRWLLFSEASGPLRVQLWISPLDRALPVPKREWILVSDAERGFARQATWAPDGNRIYMISEQDTFRCIWAQQLDARKHPVGPPFPVKHFHSSMSMVPIQEAFEISLNATRDRLFFSLVESSGNIWLTRINQP